MKLLNREVRVVLEGADKYQNLFCSVLYAEAGEPVDVAEQLSRAGLCKAGRSFRTSSQNSDRS